MKRLLALVAAVAMVAGAFVVRDRVIEDGGDGGTEQGGGDDGEPLRLLCAAELRDVCSGLPDAEVATEEVGVTVDRLATSDDPGFDAWLVPAPWPGIADVARQLEGRGPLFGEEPVALARARLAAFGPEQEVQGCPWRCLGDAAVAEALRVGAPDPASAVGLLVYAALTVGWFGAPDVATNDLREDGAYQDWVTSVAALATTADRPALQRARAGAFFDLALTTEQEVGALLATAAPERVAGLSPAYPDPVATVEIVLAGAAGSTVADALAERLADAGWRTDGLGGPTGLPGAGVLFELRALLGAA